MKNLLVLAISHKELQVEEVGKFHITADNQAERLAEIKTMFGIGELMFLSTCNRVEWVLAGLPKDFNYPAFLARIYPNVAIDLLREFQPYHDELAVEHAMKVASSLESMVIGEREIITQFRSAYEFAQKHKLSGDTLRVFSREVILAAKRIFSETDIASRPVSVVSLAFKEFQDLTQPKQAKVLVVGSGQTNTNFIRFLKKHYPKWTYSVYNRTLEGAEELASMVKGEAYPLTKLEQHQGDVDVLLACTGAEVAIIDGPLLERWQGNGIGLPKTIVDLGLPADVNPSVADDLGATLISMARLQPISKANLAARHKAVRKCTDIIEEAIKQWQEVKQSRNIELALKQLPVEMKKYRNRAEQEIFVEELAKLNPEAKELMGRMLDYLERKYVSIPYKITKSVVLNKKGKEA